MKFSVNASPLLAILMAVLTTLAFVACDKEDSQPDLQPAIVGTWDITSYKLAGDEWMGVVVDEAFLRFDAFTGPQGVFLESVTFADEETFTIEGAYSVNDHDDTVAMDYEEETIVARITFDGPDKLEWNSEESSYPLIIRATRRP